MALTEFLLARIAEDGDAAKRMPDHEDGYATHWECWDRERVLAECEAKRRIVDLISPIDKAYGFEDVAMLLALPYADHPDYRDEWKPVE